MCVIPGGCSSSDSSSFSSMDSVGKIAGIVIGSLIGLVVLICIVIAVYFTCCKKKTNSQVWAQPYPRAENYGHSQVPTQLFQVESHQMIETPPPSYEEIIKKDRSNKR